MLPWFRSSFFVKLSPCWQVTVRRWWLVRLLVGLARLLPSWLPENCLLKWCFSCCFPSQIYYWFPWAMSLYPPHLICPLASSLQIAAWSMSCVSKTLVNTTNQRQRTFVLAHSGCFFRFHLNGEILATFKFAHFLCLPADFGWWLGLIHQFILGQRNCFELIEVKLAYSAILLFLHPLFNIC